jgi:hypothetical protein
VSLGPYALSVNITIIILYNLFSMYHVLLCFCYLFSDFFVIGIFICCEAHESIVIVANSNHVTKYNSMDAYRRHGDSTLRVLRLAPDANVTSFIPRLIHPQRKDCRSSLCALESVWTDEAKNIR